MSSMRVDSAPLIANSLIVGDSGMGVAGINIPSTGEDGPSVLYQYVTLPADNETEFRMLVTSQPSTGTLTTFEDGSFIYDAPQSTTDSFAYAWFKDGVSQGVDIVNLQIGGVISPSADIAFTISDVEFDLLGGPVTQQPIANISFSIDAPDFDLQGGPTLPSPVADISFDIDSAGFNLRGGPVIDGQVISSVTVSFAENKVTVSFKD